MHNPGQSKVNGQMSNVGDVAIVLGRVPDLSRKEIELSLVRAGSRIDQLTVTSGVALVKASPNPGIEWFHTLGASVKFGVVLAVIQPDTGSLIECIQQTVGPKKTVGLSGINLGGGQLRELSQLLKLAGLTRRFVTPQAGTVLSAAQSKQFRTDTDAELLVLADAGRWIVIHIQAAQAIDDFTRRDRGAPFQHGRRGMLPTKLARTMVNLGLGLLPAVERPRLLDPFCGTGRVLMEGLLLGAEIVGSDVDPVAIDATGGNLDWLSRRYELRPESWSERLFTSDVAHLAAHLKAGSIDVIVTEPDLGPPQTHPVPPDQAHRILAALAPVYAHLLGVANQILTPTGGLVVVFPVIGEQSLRELMVDSLARFGYHALDSFRVSRDDQFVSRDIILLVRS